MINASCDQSKTPIAGRSFPLSAKTCQAIKETKR